MTPLLSSIKERPYRLLFHVNIVEIPPPPPAFMNGHELNISSSFIQLCLSVSFYLICKPYIHFIAKHASQNFGFLSRARGFFSPSQMLTIYRSQIRPSLGYCSHFSGCGPKSYLHLLDKLQSKAIRVINNSSLTKYLQSLSLSSSGCRSFYFLWLFLQTLLTGNQQYYSRSNEECSTYQKLYPITTFPSHAT